MTNNDLRNFKITIPVMIEDSAEKQLSPTHTNITINILARGIEEAKSVVSNIIETIDTNSFIDCE